jgi:hypothetical protein
MIDRYGISKVALKSIMLSPIYLHYLPVAFKACKNS